jgi:RNA-binding protein YlmH
MKKQKENSVLKQMPFRCTPELHVQIIQALGIAMAKKGQTISKNDFIVRLVKLGLKQSGTAED